MTWLNLLLLQKKKVKNNSNSITLSRIEAGSGLQPNLVLWNLTWLHQEFVSSKSIVKILVKATTDFGKPRKIPKFEISQGKPEKVTGTLSKKCYN